MSKTPTIALAALALAALPCAPAQVEWLLARDPGDAQAKKLRERLSP